MKVKKNTFFILLFLLIGSFFLYLSTRKAQTEPAYTPIVKNSSCISCHTVMNGFSASHTPNKISCTSCHLGNSNAFAKKNAHQDMVSIPGNLSNVNKTCAKCHAGIDFRVKNSLMNTMSGIISVDKHVFGENKNLDSLFSIHHLQNNTDAEKHLRNKCASCHLGNEKEKPNPINQKSRGGGCLACHLNYSDKAKIELENYHNSDKEKLPKIHPSISLNITDNHCFGCHSRSGRIATNYEGWHETGYKDTLYDNPNFRVLDDKRVFIKKEEDVHHKIGMNCIDCHDSYDVMGDGNSYSHQEMAVKVTCKDCHFANAKTIPFNELNDDEKRILLLRKKDTTHPYVVTQSERNLINVTRFKEQYQLDTKLTNKIYTLTKPTTNCTREAHQNISCSTCHTKWSPQCISCHTSYNPYQESFDLLDKKEIVGKWIEKGSDFESRFPTLGVVLDSLQQKQIKSFAIGMNLHLKKQKDTTDSFHRYFAPISAHTITKKGADCKTCHLNPATIGYGSGNLILQKNGSFTFLPKYQKEKDGLPKDAWIPFLKENKTGKSTRKNTRPFTVQEQKRILRVGVCLNCHQQKSKVIQRLLNNYEKTYNEISKKCIRANF